MHENDKVVASGTSLVLSKAVKDFMAKSLGVVLSGSLIGVLDDLQVRYLKVGNLVDWIQLLYQVGFIVAAAAAAYFILHNKTWSTRRNLSNLLMTIPIAAIGDNVSIDAATLRPYFMLIPRAGFHWRENVFGHTMVLSQLARWVNQQPLASGLINGYLAAVGIAGGYVLLQYLWSRRDR